MRDAEPLNRQVLYKGDILFEEGAPGDAAYLIKSGSVNVTSKVDGQESVIATLSRGSMVGEMAVITGEPRMATVIAAEQSELITIRPENVNKKLEDCDPFLSAFVPILIGKIRDLTQNFRKKPETFEEFFRNFGDDVITLSNMLGDRQKQPFRNDAKKVLAEFSKLTETYSLNADKS